MPSKPRDPSEPRGAAGERRAKRAKLARAEASVLKAQRTSPSPKGPAAKRLVKDKAGVDPKGAPRVRSLRQVRVASAVSPELRRIIARVTDWAGGPQQALAWCREVGIPALGGLTAEELVKAGRERAVYAFLDHIAQGGFA